MKRNIALLLSLLLVFSVAGIVMGLLNISLPIKGF